MEDPPYTRQNYETLDYVIVPKRWKHSIKNIEGDIHSNIDSDHYPLRTTTCITLKAKYKKEHIRFEYAPCNEDQKEK